MSSVTDKMVEAARLAYHSHYRNSSDVSDVSSMRAALEAAMGVAPEPGNPVSEHATPSSRWAEAGNPDPHGKQYACERAALAMGHLTDDELANEVYLKGDRKLSYTEMVAGELPASAYLLAAKDRIRWLSRALAARQQVGQEPVAWQVKDEDSGWEWAWADKGVYQMVKRHRPHHARALYEHPQPTQPHEPKVDLGQFVSDEKPIPAQYTKDDSEAQYNCGWNDCRSVMLYKIVAGEGNG